MILLGDIACPSEFHSTQLYDLFDLNQTIFKETILLFAIWKV